MVVQLGLTVLGMTSCSARSQLVSSGYAGSASPISSISASPVAATPEPDRGRAEPKSARAMFTRALLVSLTNPKTLFFYGAFFPQFVVTGHNVGTQSPS